jgi:histidine transport system ATP-binding protein
MGFAQDVSNRVVFLDQGRTEAEGSPDEVMLRPESARLRQFLARTQR